MLKVLLLLVSAAALMSIGAFEYFAGTELDWICFLFLLFALVTTLSSGLLSIRSFGRSKCVALVGLAVSAFAACWLVFLFSPGGNRIIARATAPDGTEMCLVQVYEGEPYNVSFYYRPPGGRWGWFYYDHEDTRWWRGRIRLSADGKKAVITRFWRPVAEFEIPSERFTIVRWDRTLRRAQQWMPPGWAPEQALSRRHR
jgi:hypothetical protein